MSTKDNNCKIFLEFIVYLVVENHPSLLPGKKGLDCYFQKFFCYIAPYTYYPMMKENTNFVEFDLLQKLIALVNNKTLSDFEVIEGFGVLLKSLNLHVDSIKISYKDFVFSSNEVLKNKVYGRRLSITPGADVLIEIFAKKSIEKSVLDIFVDVFESLFRNRNNENIEKRDELTGLSEEVTFLKKRNEKLLQLNIKNERYINRMQKAEKIGAFGHWEFHFNERVVYFSKGAASIYGITEKSGGLSIKDIQAYVFKEYRGLMDVALKNLIENNETYDVKFRIKHGVSGKTRVIRSIAEYDYSNKIAFGTIHDVTENEQYLIELEKAKVKAQNQEERFKSLFMGSRDGIVMVDEQGHFKACNDAYCKMLGYTEDELKQICIYDITPKKYHDWEAKEIVEKNLLTKGYTPLYEKEYIRKDGSMVPVELQAFALKNPDTLETYLWGIARDITEKKKAEKTLDENIKELEIRNKEISTLLKGAKSVLKNKDFESASKELFTYCKEITGATSGYVALLNEETKNNEVLFLDDGGAVCNVNPDLPMPIRGLRQKAYSLSEAIFHNDYMNSKWVKHLPSGHMTLKNVMFAPITIDEKAVGLIGLGNKPEDFTDYDKYIISAFAELMSVAYSNSQNLDSLVKARNIAEENYQYNKAILSAMPDLMFLLDETGKILNYHSGSQNSFYVPPQEFLNKCVSDILPTEVANLTIEKVNKVIEEKQTEYYTYTLIIRNEKRIYEARMTCVQSDEAKALAIVRDITERENAKSDLILAKDEIENKERKLSRIFDNSPILMMLLNEQLEITQINKAGASLVDKDTSFIKGEKYGDVINCVNSLTNPFGCGKGTFCKQCKVRNTILDTLNIGNTHFKVEASVKSIAKDETIQQTVLVSSVLLDDSGNNAVLVTIDDITERKNMEIDLRKSMQKAEESDRLKSAFLANMSHEIRTPMNGIVGFSKLLQNPQLTESKKNEFIQVINKSADRLLALINDLVEVSKLEAGLIKLNEVDTDVNLLLKEIYRVHGIAAKNKQINFVMSIPKPNSSFIVKLDGDRFCQVVNNLISNAIKFTDAGMIEFGYTIEDTHLLFFVKDTGIGIPQKYLDVIFDRFRQVDGSNTRQYGGTGLGLSISKSIVEKMNGKMMVHSKEREGSTFFFTLPIRKHISVPDTKEALGNDNKMEFEVKRRKILVAEDEEVNRFFIEELLSQGDFEVINVQTGKEAIELYYSHKPDIILMDIKMPVLSGIEAIKAIRKDNENIPIIAQTAYAGINDREDALNAGATSYITKPINPEDLKKELIRLLK